MAEKNSKKNWNHIGSGSSYIKSLLELFFIINLTLLHSGRSFFK